jgi:hypothetical protein
MPILYGPGLPRNRDRLAPPAQAGNAAGLVSETIVFGPRAPIASVTYAAVRYEASAVVLLPMLVGNAVAAGSQARIGANLALPMFVGNAVAAGRQAQIGANLRLAMLVGNAVAAGSQASVGENTRLPMLAGNAVAAGLSATVSIFSLRVTYAAALYEAAPIEFRVGNAVAAGPQGAEVIVESTISFDRGNAVASGPQGTTVNVDQVIYCDIGNAIGCGYTVGGLYWRPAYSKPGAWMPQGATNNKWADRTRAHC